MLQLIFDREPMHDTPSALTYRAISNCNVVTRKYTHVWGIDVLFKYWATQPADQMLTNLDLQIKLASLLLSVCFLRITEISEIDLNLSNFNFKNRTALITLLPQTTNALEQYEVRRTGILNLCPNVTLFTWLERLREHFYQEITTLSSLFWTEQWKSMSIAKISEFLNPLIKKIGIECFTPYSIKHASTTKLASFGVNERDLNVCTNHAPDSKSTKNYYVYAANRQVNDIAAKLVMIENGPKDQDPTQKCGDIMMSPFETSVPPLSHPVFLPNPLLELKIQTDTNNLSNDSFKTLTVLAQDELIHQPTETGQPTFNHVIPFSGANKPSTSQQDVSSDKLPLKTRRSLMNKDFSPSNIVKKHK
ncbi:MAG: hypothetical protein EZS28_039954 [Streblomastix strix]|uniref:Tyr recombinase domain-containing protein n=1 Tax=Streblomastix strix TaxID=222440 RepID=A0A5J4U2K0_9EUKA|nr:MAG: hypothetical protein EZS28_039954 [Streblomastix strix]